MSHNPNSVCDEPGPRDERHEVFYFLPYTSGPAGDFRSLRASILGNVPASVCSDVFMTLRHLNNVHWLVILELFTAVQGQGIVSMATETAGIEDRWRPIPSVLWLHCCD